MPNDKVRLILLIEDDAAAAEALLLILRDWGAEVIVSHDGASFPTSARERMSEVRWIITDLHLGDGEDGITRVQRLRGAAPNARVLVLSGSFTGQTTSQAVEAGFDVIDKPAHAKSIIEWLERA
jgi:DNA-binding response OmpR family regulator